MARPKEFDPDQALDCAIEVFRYRGYEATSVQDLVDAMGIHRASLYDTFGDKHDLYLAALDRYDRIKFAEYSAILSTEGEAIAAIHRLFAQVVDTALASGGITFGCLTTNSTMERAALDPKIAERAHRNFVQMECLFLTTLEIARAQGEIAGNDNELRSLARFLVSTLKGIRVTAKADCERAVFDDILTVAFSVLENRRPAQCCN